MCSLFNFWGVGGTSASTKMSHWPEISTFPFLGGGYISLNQNVTLTWDFNFPIPGRGTPARTKMSHCPEISTFPILGGGREGYISQNQNVTLTWDFILGGGVHQPEPKCNINLRFHSGGGGTSARTKMSHWYEISFFGGGGVHQPEPKCHIDLRFHSWGRGYTSQNQNVTLIWDFILWGGGTSARTKMSHRKSLELASTFPFLGGGGVTAAGRSEKCRVYG